MACIYLRMPTSRCQFYRNRDDKHPLQSHEPIKFSEYSEEYYVLKTSIYNKALSNKADSRFFSQQEWRNMMYGKDPLGKQTILKRDSSVWLSYDEITCLMGNKTNGKTELFDYLCIKLPTEVYCIDGVRTVSPSWSISAEGYESLTALINNDFKRTVIEWALATFDFCTSNGRVIIRSHQAMLERFLMRYSIFPTEEEKSNLRRVIERWFKQEQCNFNSYTNLNMRYSDAKEEKVNIDGVVWL